jgi:hypothetical protein
MITTTTYFQSSFAPSEIRKDLKIAAVVPVHNRARVSPLQPLPLPAFLSTSTFRTKRNSQLGSRFRL